MPNWKKLIVSGSDASLNSLNLSSVVNAGTDTDKFLVLDGSGNVDFRTGANVLSDIGGQASGNYVTDSGGAACQVAVWSSGTAISGSNSLFFDTANNRLSIGNSGSLSDLSLPAGGGAQIGWDGTNNIRAFIKHTRSGNKTQLSFGTTTNANAAQERVRIDEDGNLGIGTTSPAEKLTVEGNISGSGRIEIGTGHTNSGTLSSIGGGTSNTITSGCGFIGGGSTNIISALLAFVGGGVRNHACKNYSVIGGGYENRVIGSGGHYGVVAGGRDNHVCNLYGGILGGISNTVSHNCSFIVGSNLTSDKACYTFMNNLDVAGIVSGSTFSGSFVGNGSGLTGVTATSFDIDALTAGTSLHQTQDHFLFSDNGTEKKITFSNLEDAIFGNISGDATVAAGGALTIANDAVETSMIAHSLGTLGTHQFTGSFSGSYAGDGSSLTGIPTTLTIDDGTQLQSINLQAEDILEFRSQNANEIVVDTSVTNRVTIGLPDNVTISNSLTVGGTVTAQEFHTEFVSASIVFQSGSTKFGDTTDDIHSFTGSLNVTGSLGVTGNLTISAGHIETDQIYLADKILHSGDSDTYIAFEDNTHRYFSAGEEMIKFNSSLITLNEAGGNNDIRIKGNSDNNLFYSDGSADKIGIGTITPDEKLTVEGNISASGNFIGSDITGSSLNLSSVVNAGTDTDKFLVLDSSGNVDFRTGTQVRSDIGAGTGNGTVTGTGTEDTVPKWSSGGAGLQDSQITDDGTNVEIDTTGTTKIGDISAVADNGYLQLNGTDLEYYAAGSLRFKVQDDDNIAITENIYHIGDTNTKIGFVANDTFAITTAGSERIRVTSTGNVGIGTTTPSVPLEIADSDNTLLYLSSSTANVYLRLDDNTSTNGNFVGATGNEMHFWTNNTRAMTISSSQYVGIGTTSPAEKLTVAGNISGSGCIQIGTGHSISGTMSSIGGGINHTISGNCSFIGGGCDNCITGNCSFVGGGRLNCANNVYSTVGGGFENAATTGCSTIAGGYNNCTCTNNWSFIGGGHTNIAAGASSVVAGGYNNKACGCQGFIGAGQNNTISSGQCYGIIVGGQGNTVDGTGCSNTIGGGGTNNCIHAASGFDKNTISGGGANCILCNNENATIAGGSGNIICRTSGTDYGSTIGGGAVNCLVTGTCWSTISGGYLNCSTSNLTFIGGGTLNTGSGAFSGILGGKNNYVNHANSMIIGSDLTSDKACYTFMNNLDVEGTVSGSVFSGSFVGDGSGLTGISGGGSIDGSGAANKLAIWSDSDTLTNDTNLHWDTSGDCLGVGVSSPQAILDVAGTNSTGKSLQVRSGDTNSGTDSAQVIFAFNNNSWNSNGYAHSIRTRHNSGANTDNAIDFYVWNTSDTNASTLGATRVMTIEGTSRVGIGTATPDAQLHVSSGTSGDATVIIEADTDNNAEGDVPRLWFKTDGDITEGALQLNDNELELISNVDSAGGIVFKTGTTNNTGTTDPATGATERMRITSAGNVGIGTTAPDTKLHVEGNLLVDAYNVGEDNGIFLREGFLTTDQPSITVWDMSNSGVSPDGLSINSQDGIRFRENGGEVARFKDGKFGIGETDPAQALHVSGRGLFDTGASTPDSTTGTYEKGITLTGGNMRLVMDTSDVTNGGSYIQTRHQSTSFPNAYYRLHLNPLGGCVGINAGTLAPTGSLHVEGPTYIKGGSIDVGDSVSTAAIVMDCNTCIIGRFNGQYLRTIIGTDNANNIRIGQSGTSLIHEINLQPGTSGGCVRIYDNSSEYARFTNSKFGIGTTNPQATLHADYGSTVAPSLTFGATAGQILQNENSEFAFGLHNASPYPLWIQGRNSGNSARNITLQPLGGNIGIGTYSPSTLLDVDGTTTTVTLVETSTKELKEDIQPLDSQLENLKKLKPIEFAWKKDKKKDFGLLAEDVEKVYPYLVEHDEEDKLIGVKYSKLTSVLVKALQEQQEQIDELKEEIKVLKQK